MKFIQGFLVFFKIGLVTIGGGYAMLPVIEREIVEKRGWATEEDVLNSYALAQTVPGIIGLNTAVFLGYRMGKSKIAVANALGVITPSMVIITLIAQAYEMFANNQLVQNAFTGIRVAVVALLISTLVKLIKKSIVDGFTLAIAIAACCLLLFFPITPILIIVLGGLLSIVYYSVKERGDRE